MKFEYISTVAATPGWTAVFVCSEGHLHFSPIACWESIRWIPEDEDIEEDPDIHMTVELEPMISCGFGLSIVHHHPEYGDGFIGVAGPGEQELETWKVRAAKKLRELAEEDEEISPAQLKPN